jgi:hypothetical protein
MWFAGAHRSCVGVQAHAFHHGKCPNLAILDHPMILYSEVVLKSASSSLLINQAWAHVLRQPRVVTCPALLPRTPLRAFHAHDVCRTRAFLRCGLVRCATTTPAHARLRRSRATRGRTSDSPLTVAIVLPPASSSSSSSHRVDWGQCPRRGGCDTPRMPS